MLMSTMLYTFYFLILCQFSSVAGTGESCDSGKGVCIDVNTDSCSGSLKTGYCSGPENIVCCESYVGQPCDNNKGTCVDVSTDYYCEGLVKSGYCPGPSSIMCCEPGAAVPDRCMGTGPSLLNSSYEFTLQNQGKSCKCSLLILRSSFLNNYNTILIFRIFWASWRPCLRPVYV